MSVVAGMGAAWLAADAQRPHIILLMTDLRPPLLGCRPVRAEDRVYRAVSSGIVDVAQVTYPVQVRPVRRASRLACMTSR